MKIGRCVTEDGCERVVAYHSETDVELLLRVPERGGFEPTGVMMSARKMLAPIEPRAIFAIGLNYRKHAEETGAKIPDYPVLFMKSVAALQNPGDPITLPRHLCSEQVDYEAELAFVISRDCRNVSRDRAMDFVLGFTCANDVSARDWQLQRSGRQWCRAKSFDTFCPLGPWIVTPDEMPPLAGCSISTRLNGEVMQESVLGDMIFGIPELIEFLSGSTTLLAGTVVLTGTPSGVGMSRTPPVWLQPGDRVEIGIDGIGTLANPVIAESVAAE